MVEYYCMWSVGMPLPREASVKAAARCCTREERADDARPCTDASSQCLRFCIFATRQVDRVGAWETP